MQQKIRHKSSEKEQSPEIGQRVSQTHWCGQSVTMQPCCHPEKKHPETEDACRENCVGTCPETGRSSYRREFRLTTAPFIFLIKVYRTMISPLFPPCCRFQPTCSAYALSALQIHGLLKGSLLTIWRILRCNPFVKGGYDPVPPKGAWRPQKSD